MVILGYCFSKNRDVSPTTIWSVGDVKCLFLPHICVVTYLPICIKINQQSMRLCYRAKPNRVSIHICPALYTLHGAPRQGNLTGRVTKPCEDIRLVLNTFLDVIDMSSIELPA